MPWLGIELRFTNQESSTLPTELWRLHIGTCLIQQTIYMSEGNPVWISWNVLPQFGRTEAELRQNIFSRQKCPVCKPQLAQLNKEEMAPLYDVSMTWVRHEYNMSMTEVCSICWGKPQHIEHTSVILMSYSCHTYVVLMSCSCCTHVLNMHWSTTWVWQKEVLGMDFSKSVWPEFAPAH